MALVCRATLLVAHPTPQQTEWIDLEADSIILLKDQFQITWSLEDRQTLKVDRDQVPALVAIVDSCRVITCHLTWGKIIQELESLPVEDQVFLHQATGRLCLIVSLPTPGSLNHQEVRNVEAQVHVSTPTCSPDFITQLLVSPVTVLSLCRIFHKSVVLVTELVLGKAIGSVLTIEETKPTMSLQWIGVAHEIESQK